ncbi:Rad52/Rad22 family DNA repair protein (plasmid) [Alkalihalophilus pseudofirmus]|uniref:Rad52/Rad22 family DNA repair protein n=1 Tax=Alkalihalophilus pseudofirmus TaxID=79885 RepID=UPI00259B9648|nr:Rad52/Rad22 family DNA repair protein [Alkalihalophilus pseudofirmus]WEG19212.1 Rad52/Rad22 family DNA repair protein [Alkalihalophilus pseudofirmus]
MTTFNDLIDKLCEPFPKEVHEPRYDGHGTYIPIHVYLQRLNEVAGEYWTHERVGEPIFYMEDKLVHTVVKVSILNRSHMGEGFSKFQVNDKGKIINRHYAIRSATKDGIRDAISFFGMGKPLQSTTRSTTPSSITDDQQSFFTTDRTCVKCNVALSEHDLNELTTLKIKFDYCTDHIPKHLKKKSTL